MIKTDKPTFRSSDPMRTKIILNKVGQQRYKKKKYKRGSNAWSLGPTERSSSEYGAYVHNSVKNFAKQIRLNDIDKSLLNESIEQSNSEKTKPTGTFKNIQE